MVNLNIDIYLKFRELLTKRNFIIFEKNFHYFYFSLFNFNFSFTAFFDFL
jgi:hypothetical protein